ncbi:MAG: SMEK domain-containing protein [Gemmataceae bacterium]
MLLAKETLISEIRSGLAVFQDYVRPGGKLNLTDPNVQSEDFVAGLLNAVYGWSLLSTNKAKANYSCIDLIDDTRKLGIQVTAEGGSDKLTSTLECLAKHKMARDISLLKVFLLIPKQGKYTVNAACPGITFDWKTDVIDCDDIALAAQAIDDLQQLRRVHQFVVDSMPRLFPNYHPVHLPGTDEPKLPRVVRVQLLPANPAEMTQLDLTRDIRGIKEKLRMSGARPAIDIVSSWADSFEGLQQYLFSIQPRILHIRGGPRRDDPLTLRPHQGGEAVAVPNEVVRNFSHGSGQKYGW